MSGRISLKLIEELEKEKEEAVPRIPIYFNQYVEQADVEESRRKCSAFVAEKLKEEKKKKLSKPEKTPEKEIKKAGKSVKTSEKKSKKPGKQKKTPEKRKKKVCKSKETPEKKGRTSGRTDPPRRAATRGRKLFTVQSESSSSSSESSTSEDSSSDSTSDSANSQSSTIVLSQRTKRRLRELHNKLEKEREELEISYVGPDLSVIEEAHLDDTDDYDPLIDDINVKVRCHGKILIKTIKRVDKLSQVFTYVAKENSVPAVRMIIYFKDLPVSVNDTPKELGMTLADILECVIFPSTEYSQKNPNCIEVKLQSKDSKIKNIVLIHLVDPFSVMMKKYSEIRSLPLDKLAFEFDGDKISPDETPLDYDMEDGNVIDVKIIQ